MKVAEKIINDVRKALVEQWLKDPKNKQIVTKLKKDFEVKNVRK